MSGISQTKEEKAAEAKAAKAAKAAEKVKVATPEELLIKHVNVDDLSTFVSNNHYVYAKGHNKKLCVSFDGRFFVAVYEAQEDEKGAVQTYQRNVYVGRKLHAAVNAYNKH
jgi:flavin-binding protein dodecin